MNYLAAIAKTLLNIPSTSAPFVSVRVAIGIRIHAYRTGRQNAYNAFKHKVMFA